MLRKICMNVVFVCCMALLLVFGFWGSNCVLKN